jgi:hypothetical protein
MGTETLRKKELTMAKFISDAEMSALESGAQGKPKAFISDEEMNGLESAQASPSVPNAPSAGESGLRGAIGGAVAGFDDEITGAVGAVGRVLGAKNLGSWKPFDPNSKLEVDSPTLSADEIVQAYRENRDAIRNEQKIDMETNPKATIAGNVAGAIISPAGKLRAGQGMGPLTRMGTLKQAAKTAALQGAVFGAGSSDADLTKGEVGEFAGDVAGSAAFSAAIPVGLEAGKRAIGAGFDAAKWAGRKAFSATFGVTDDNVRAYLANPERINGAKSLDEIKNIADESVEKLREAVEQGKATEIEAKEALKALQEQVTRGLADKKVDAKDALRAAESAFAGARERVLEPLKSKVAPTNRAGEVAAMVGELKSKVQSLSGDALKSLKTSGEEVDLSKVYSRIYETIDRLKSAGTDEAMGIISKLEAYKARLMQAHWAKVPAEEAKRMIQGLDEVTSYSPMAGSFDQAKNRAFKGIRSELDQTVKGAVPAYRQQMSELAPKVQLLDDANSAFGTPEMAVGRLGRLNTPRGEFDRAILGKLEEAVGKGGAITREADEFARAQRILKDPQAIRKIEESLPEFQTLRRAMADVARRNPKWTRQQIEQATAKQRRALAEAVGKRIFAQKKLEPFKKLTRDSTEGRLKSLMKRDPNIENKRVFEQLGKQTGKDFVQMADDLRVKEAFEGGATNGSRNTLFWGILGFATGGVPGALGGAAFGHQVIDKYGPVLGKKILDAGLKIKNNPRVETIRKLDLPPAIKQELERDFKLYMISKQSGEMRAAGRVAEEQPKGEKRWALNGAKLLGIEDQALVERVMQSPKGMGLLILASELPVGSKKHQEILNQISQGWEKPNGNQSSSVSVPEVSGRERKPSGGR